MNIKERMIKAGVPFFANDNISKYLEDGDLEKIQVNVEVAMQGVLDALLIDTTNDHNTIETAKRVAKMYVREVFKGRYLPRPAVTDFPNAKQLDEMYTVGPITVRSACSHHLVPILGMAWIGVIPGERVIGLSKFNRLTEWVMARPHIQEEAAVMLADEIEGLIKPKGLAVVIRAAHQCTTWRGIKESNMHMTTSIMRGLLMENDKARNEFLTTIRGSGF
jgi:GTP cyclohydrolase I